MRFLPRNMISYSAGRIGCFFSAENNQRLIELIGNLLFPLDQKFMAKQIDIILFFTKPIPLIKPFEKGGDRP